MATISSLVVKISAKTTQFKTAVSDAKKRMEGFGDVAKKSAASIKRGFNVIAIGVKAIAAAAAVGIGSVTAFFAAITIKANTIKQIKIFSDQLGVSVENLQRWQFAAKRFGVEGDRVADIFKDVSDKINDFVLTGGGEAGDIFEKLALDAKDFIGLSPDKAFERIGAAMQGFTRGEQIFFMEALANDASVLLPLLDDNAAGFKRLSAEAERSGNVLSTSQVNAAAKFSETVAGMIAKAKGFFNQVTGFLVGPLDIMIKRLDEMTASFGGPQEAAKEFAKVLINSIAGMLDGLASIVQAIGDVQLSFNSLKGTASGVKGAVGTGFQLLGYDFGKGMADGARADQKALLADRANITARQNALSKSADSIRSLANQMTDAVDKSTADDGSLSSPEDKNTKATDQNTTAVNSLARYMKEQDKKKATDTIKSTSTGAAGGFGAVDAGKIFEESKKTTLKTDLRFEMMAKNLQEAITSGSSTGDIASRLSGLGGAIETLKSFPALNYDIAGMSAVFEKLRADAIRTFENFGGPQFLTREEYKAIFDEAFSKNQPKDIGTLTLNVNTGERSATTSITGKSSDLAMIKQIIDGNTNNLAKAVAN